MRMRLVDVRKNKAFMTLLTKRQGRILEKIRPGRLSTNADVTEVRVEISERYGKTKELLLHPDVQVEALDD